jgi:ribosomal protein S18 acetylase RimI-like enzyme
MMRLVPWTPEDLGRRLDDVIAVYGDAMGYRPEVLATRRGYIATHLRRPGFRAVATLASDGSLIGFGYGYHSEPGQWWHDQVSAALDPAARKTWLSDCFEVVELHVRTAAHGHGLGSRQLRALLRMAEGTTTLLSTPEDEEESSRAWRLYRKFGFVDVLRHLRFPGDSRAFAVLGRTLPLEDDPVPARPSGHSGSSDRSGPSGPSGQGPADRSD